MPATDQAVSMRPWIALTLYGPYISRKYAVWWQSRRHGVGSCFAQISIAVIWNRVFCRSGKAGAPRAMLAAVSLPQLS
jgi:hypothetical protein